MRFPRTALPFVMVLLLALLVVACGGGETSGDGNSRDDEAATERDAGTGGATPNTPEERTTGGAFAVTPELADCMGSAGFEQDAPPTGALAAWRQPDGARAVVAASEDVTQGIASEIGAGQDNASVDGTTVVAGPPELTRAASACLDG